MKRLVFALLAGVVILSMIAACTAAPAPAPQVIKETVVVEVEKVVEQTVEVEKVVEKEVEVTPTPEPAPEQ